MASPAKQRRKPATPRLGAAAAKRAGSVNKPDTDWVGIELAYTTSARTLEDIGAEFGISKGRVSQKAKEMGWTRGSMADRVRAKAEAKVAAVQAHAAGVQANTEAAIDSTAVVMANTILRQRRDVGRLINLADKLMIELEQPRRTKEARAQPLPVRIDSLRKLGDTVGRLTVLEREVMGITGSAPIDPTRRVEEAIESGMDKLRERFKARGLKV